ncbi:hypothetical protein RHMOL_Rhmol13G0205800 [Rhododendron molle]|uniref:Uncharacterized protein n=1 Tax=Rhododendron molle TaxID=49168 RepID=A0ACC0L9Q7_RHOML|nr:hypothetical protein RHMOL_Rhmol13G0205800 [Rhododendron molle]
MGKLSPTICFLLVVLFYASDTVNIKLVAGQTCKEVIGLCRDCDHRCKSRHPSRTTTSDCDFNTGPSGIPKCVCSYKCETQCNGSGGLCSLQCGPECCNAICAAKFNSGRGYCDNSSGVNACQCQYAC